MKYDRVYNRVVDDHDKLLALFNKYLILADTHLCDSDIEVLASYDEDSRYETIISDEEVAQIKEMQKHVSRVERVRMEQCKEKREIGCIRNILFPCVLVEGHPGKHAFNEGKAGLYFYDEEGNEWDGDGELVY